MRKTELEGRYRCFQSFFLGGGGVGGGGGGCQLFKLGRVLIQPR